MDFKAIDLVTGQEISAIVDLWVTDKGTLIASVVSDGVSLNILARDIDIQPNGN